jgi:hypothetical protein
VLVASKFEKDLDKFAKKLGSVFELATAVGAIDDYADAIVEQIQSRTRAGRGVAFTGQLGGNESRFVPLKESYRKARKKYYAGMIRAADGAPNKSSLTFTGQMLASLEAKVSKTARGKTSIKIEPTGNRQGGGPTNKELARWHSTGKGNLPKRAFLGLTRLDQSKVNKKFAKTFSDIVRGVFK